MKHMNIHKQTVGETHLPSNTKPLYKVHLACARLLPTLALGSGVGVVLCRASRGETRSRHRAPGHWIPPLLISTPPGKGQHARHGREVGGGGPANVYLREETHHQKGRQRESPCHPRCRQTNTHSGPEPSGRPFLWSAFPGLLSPPSNGSPQSSLLLARAKPAVKPPAQHCRKGPVSPI